MVISGQSVVSNQWSVWSVCSVVDSGQWSVSQSVVTIKNLHNANMWYKMLHKRFVGDCTTNEHTVQYIGRLTTCRDLNSTKRTNCATCLLHDGMVARPKPTFCHVMLVGGRILVVQHARL